MFTVMNDPVRQKVYHWNSNGFKTIYDYQEALSMKIMTIENWAKHGQHQGFKIKD